MQKEIVFSLVTTVLNDVKGTEVFLERMAEQTVQPDEIVIVDGGSTDGTWELLQHASQLSLSGIPILVHQEPGCNVARGRDLAIEHFRSNYILIQTLRVGSSISMQR